MFSSEQVFEVSGDFSQLELAIEFAIKMYEFTKNGVTYQVTKDGKFCLGWAEGDGWVKFPFDFDPHIVAEIVKQHLRKNRKESEWSNADGSTDDGFLMKAIDQVFSSEENGIKKPFYGIVSIEYFENFYAK